MALSEYLFNEYLVESIKEAKENYKVPNIIVFTKPSIHKKS